MFAGGLRIVEPGVDQLACAQTKVPVVHGVFGTGGVGQRLVHAGNDGADAGVGGKIAIEHSAQPMELRIGEFIVAGVVEGDEVDALAGPVVPRAEGCTVRAIGFALGSDFGAIEEAGELVDVAFAGHRLDGFVVAAAQEDGKGTEGSHLVGEEIVPRHAVW